MRQSGVEEKIDLLLYGRRGEYDARGSRSSFRGTVAPSGASSSGGGGGSVVQAGGRQGVLARLTNLRRIIYGVRHSQESKRENGVLGKYYARTPAFNV